MIGRKILAIGVTALALTGFLAAFPANAQERPGPYTRTGSLIAMPAEKLAPGLARVMLKNLAHCAYRSHKDLAERFLRHSDQKAVDYDALGFTEADVFKKFGLGECLGETRAGFDLRAMMRLTPGALRVALAEESYLGQNSMPLRLPEGSKEILSNRYVVQSASAEQARGLDAFSDCVVFHAPADADRLLRTTPASSDEGVAARALVPALSQCLKKGQQVSLNAKGIRGIVADGLWARTAYSADAPTEDAQ